MVNLYQPDYGLGHIPLPKMRTCHRVQLKNLNYPVAALRSLQQQKEKPIEIKDDQSYCMSEAFFDNYNYEK